MTETMSPLKVFFVCALAVLATATRHDKNAFKNIKQKMSELEKNNELEGILLDYLRENAFPPMLHIGGTGVESIEYHSLWEGYNEVFFVVDFKAKTNGVSPAYSPFPCQAIIYVDLGPLSPSIASRKDGDITDFFDFTPDKDMACVSRRVPQHKLC